MDFQSLNNNALAEAMKEALATSTENMKVAAEHVAELVRGSKDVSSLTKLISDGLTSNNPNTRQHACIITTALAKNRIPRLEPYLAPLLGHLLGLYADKKFNIRSPAAEAALAIVDSTNPNAIRVLLPFIFDAMECTKKWQSKVGALNLIGHLADIAPVQVSRCLPDI
ncbi:elongation factor 3, partial [Thraustotheca clavata]